MTCAASLATGSTEVHLSTDAHQSARLLLVQAPPPLPMRTNETVAPSMRESQLLAEIDTINDQLRGLKTDWPTVSVVLAYLGWSLSPIALVGLLFLAVGVGVPGASVVAIVGIGMLVVGLGGVAMGIIGIATGIAASSAAKSERDELIQRRQVLERELKQVRMAPGVDRSFEVSPTLITVAAF